MASDSRLLNRIEQDQLEPGDHIYSYRNIGVYAHHGIFVGNMRGMADAVIHFTNGPLEPRPSGNFLSDFFGLISSVSSSTSGRTHSQCNRTPVKGHGVILSCLDCFLFGGSLYRFRYGVSNAFFHEMPIYSCSCVEADTNETAVRRAERCLDVGYGHYNFATHNCIDFAIYCKTGHINFKNFLFFTH